MKFMVNKVYFKYTLAVIVFNICRFFSVRVKCEVTSILLGFYYVCIETSNKIIDYLNDLELVKIGSSISKY